jgi:acetyl esterase/lipase
VPGLYLLRQLLTSALTANGLHPARGHVTGVPAMLAGWLTSELAPHLTALTVADAARELTRPRPDTSALVLAAANVAGLAAMTAQSAAARRHVDAALVETLGADYRERLAAAYTDLDLSSPLRQLVWPFRIDDDEVERIRDIPYARDHGKRGLLDVYRQRDSERTDAPVLLQVHGGAWSIGDKDHQGVPLMLHMAARGWVCVAINYRLSPRDAFPAQLVDVKRALAWVRAHIGEYGGDPSFVAVTGGSAGGHLAAMAALTPHDPEYQPGFEDADTSVQAAVPFYGVYDLAAATGTRRAEQMRDRFLAPKVLFKDPRVERAAFEKASPLLRVGPHAPPMFVIHGTHDSLVEVTQAREFVRRLREVSDHHVAYAELPGTQHAFDVFPSIRSAHVTRAVDRFLRWTYDAATEVARDTATEVASDTAHADRRDAWSA